MTNLKNVIGGTALGNGQGGVLIREFDEDGTIPLNPEATAIFVDEQTSRIHGDSDERNPEVLVTQLETTQLLTGKKLAIYFKLA